MSAAAAARLASRGAPRVGIVLGSGLGAVADAVTGAKAIGYEELPGFPRPGVAGHAGRAVLGRLGGVRVAVLQGRAHLYEGGEPEARRAPVRALRAAGAELVVLTNAAGSLRPEVGPGRLMAITDHINLTGQNPLVGPNDDGLGPRFPSLRDAYDPALRAALRAAAGDRGIDLAEGVYLAVSGPSFETPAEIRAFRALGADAVGMSTVHETIVARHCGLRVAAISVITNLAEGLADEPLSHDATLADAQRAAGDLAALLEAFAAGAMTPGELLALVDLTRLERPDDPAAVDALVPKALTPAGRVAALCVYPEWIARVRDAGVPVAAVIAFPEGPNDPPAAASEAAEAVAAGAAEVDVVVPWSAWLEGEEDAIGHTVRQVRAAVGPEVAIKAILETGSLPGAEAIRAAGVAALEAGADFLKTSTGKLGPGASPEAVRELLEVVLATGRGGVKASGGIRTAEQAQAYVDLAGEVMGPGWVAPERFRLGASGLVDDLLARVIPKAELHVHLEGTAPPALVRSIAARNGLDVPDGLFASDERFAWTDFLDFLRAYDRAASVIRTAQDYRDIAFSYLRSCAADGAVYVELIASPDHADAAGLSDAEHFGAIAAGIDDARAAFGIQARIVATAIRNLGAERVLTVARRAAARPHPYVVGFNLSGDEAGFPPGQFAEAYAVAAGAGLGCTVHAGEWAGAASVHDALSLPVTRISHGVRAIEDPAVVAELAARGIVLEICPTSNVALGLFPTYEAHPLPALMAAGVLVTLGSDDPPWFGATLGGEYAIARERMGLDDAALRAITRTALGAAFPDRR